MIIPGQHDHDEPHDRDPAKPDRWLVGLLAGAALMYFAGKILGLGQRPAPEKSRSARTTPP